MRVKGEPLALISFVNDGVIKRSLGVDKGANLLRIAFHSPVWAEEFVRLAAIQMTMLSLKPDLRELVILYSSRILRSGYVWAHHQSISQAAGVSEEQLAALSRGDATSAVFSEKEQALLQFVSKIAESEPMSKEEFLPIRKHFSEQELVEIVALHGLVYTKAKLTSAFEVEIDPFKGLDHFESVIRAAGKPLKTGTR
jgi:alkylhydroperoxidase family enzyme